MSEVPSAESRTIEGFYQWDPGIVVTADCLGETFATKLLGGKLNIGMPVANGESGFLGEPPMLYRRPASYVNVDSDDAWGELRSWNTLPDGTNVAQTVNVKRVRVVTVIGADADPHVAAVPLDQQLDNWWVVLRAWVEVLTRQDLSMLGDRKRLGPNIFHLWTGDDDGVMKPLPMMFTARFFPPADALTADGFRLCLQKAAVGEMPPLEWLFLRDARSLHNADEWRRSVIDAATAAEISITTWLDRNAPPDVRASLMSRPRPLGPLSELFSDNGGQLPVDFLSRLVRPRNDAAHRGNMLSGSTSQAAIDTASALLAAASPLTSTTDGPLSA